MRPGGEEHRSSERTDPGFGQQDCRRTGLNKFSELVMVVLQIVIKIEDAFS
ncbi:hypothetical protein BAURA86_04029 [Brevibacterium aurantiacum]|uniref:Uncharacterized protein n=1 Tax=Brevibacterium aurantiacum TaxID=273384 RepID=A0A2H1L0F5_BREAU|nr:hypothetical protein BAURA86_04029 [Brevibacterium aurantiacum]